MLLRKPPGLLGVSQGLIYRPESLFSSPDKQISLRQPGTNVGCGEQCTCRLQAGKPLRQFANARVGAAQVGEVSAVKLSIYDVHGRLVRTLVDGMVEAGSHTVLFDGKNAAGARLASNVYFLRLVTPAIMQVRQVTLVK